MSSAAGSAGQGVETPVRVYVGSQEAQMLPVKVLEYSIRKHTELPVEIFPLHHASIEVPMPRDPRNRPRTPFSFQRFYIPQLAGFRGRAIYLDHGGGLVTAYFHLSRADVRQGQRVRAGQRIGAVGRSGRVTGPHLHWVAWYGTISVDPMSLLQLEKPPVASGKKGPDPRGGE